MSAGVPADMLLHIIATLACGSCHLLTVRIDGDSVLRLFTDVPVSSMCDWRQVAQHRQVWRELVRRYVASLE